MKKLETKKERITVWLPPSLIREIKKRAKLDRRTLAGYCEIVFEKEIKNETLP